MRSVGGDANMRGRNRSLLIELESALLHWGESNAARPNHGHLHWQSSRLRLSANRAICCEKRHEAVR